MKDCRASQTTSSPPRVIGEWFWRPASQRDRCLKRKGRRYCVARWLYRAMASSTFENEVFCHLHREDAVASTAGIVHGRAAHGPARHALVDQPLHGVRRFHHHFLRASAAPRIVVTEATRDV